MRTTINIDEDVLLAVQERARREKRSAGEVLSDLARRTLTHATGESGTRNGFPVSAGRGGPVTNGLIDQLREDGPY